MLCPKCNRVAAIRGTRYVTSNDDTPDKETKLFIEQDFACRNQQCADYGKVIATKRNELRLGKDAE